ncbi:hypothetical protein SZ25_00399 [Candidatus Arcanobacter lacustris]|jgi:hypothetical protein|uniref:Uncharacterized protein n=1 Tax=Candidatus Arcanibacter lacustris TaxID=1607817 RepID=A0A0F5MNZ2_9RICK|nr:hypothetical protein SZ25_00399 [Candidatus Arcanobacter lacustris]
MAKKTIQKLVPLDSRRKDMKKIESDLADGWVISNMMPHEDGFLCVLEKSIETSDAAIENEERFLSSLLSSSRDSSQKTKKTVLEKMM